MLSNRRNRGRKGFTMIELMVVVVVVGILASIAVPMYGKYVKNARMTEATGRMGEIITACKAWAQEHQDGSGNPTWPDDNAAVAGSIVDVTATENFTYTLEGNGNANTGSLVVTATGRARMNGVGVEVTVATIGANGGAPVITGL
jgi:type IV pilus assembly protein PilE